jgi:aryl-alcohol dehydrogenase-like predicted oxidoreductase
MSRNTRRDFLRTTAGVVTGAALGAHSAVAANRSATDWVTLGNSGVDVTRLAMGTGGNGGRMQREMGQEAFTKVVRHAWDRGIRFFESADAYGTHKMVAEALKGYPRDEYRLMTKMKWKGETDPMATIDRFRKELNTDHLDILLLHVVTIPDWPNQLEPLRDAFSEAKAKGIIRAHGASIHGLKPLRDCPGTKWMDISLNRVNHNGTKMDSEAGGWNDVGDISQATSNIKKIHAQGTGVIGMKLIGNGAFTDYKTRDESIKFVTSLDYVDSYTIGLLKPEQIDENIDLLNKHLNA